MGVRFFSGERFICEQKDLDRARSCTSEAKAMAQLNAITDLDKLFRRGIAFATVGQYGTDPKPWMDKAKQLGASNDDVQRFYQELIKAGKTIDPTNEDMLMAALAMLAAGKAAQQAASIETTQVIKPVEEPADEVVEEEIITDTEVVEPEAITGEGKTFSMNTPYINSLTKNVLSHSDLTELLTKIKNGVFDASEYYKYKDAALSDYTLFCALFDPIGGPDFNWDKLVPHTELKVGVIDLGWDVGCDYALEALDIFCGDSYYIQEESPSYLATRYKTINFFDYYNKFSNIMSDELSEIYGHAQECYAGISNDRFIVGFDVTGGSVLARMPICPSASFIIKEVKPGRGYDFDVDWSNRVFPIYYRSTSFYGKGDDHFYPTDRRNYLAEKDLRLD